jgi:type IV secretory pathway VirB4 component
MNKKIRVNFRGSSDILFPKIINENRRYIKVDDRFYKMYYLHDFPQDIIPFYFSDFLNLNANIIIRQFLQPIDRKALLQGIKMRIASLSAKRHRRLSSGKIRDMSLDVEISNLEDFNLSIVNQEEEGVFFGIVIAISENSISKLNASCRNFELFTGSRSFKFYPLDLRHSEGFKSILHSSYSNISLPTIINLNTVVASTPFTSNNLIDFTGIIYGININTKSVVSFDIFKFENYNAIVFAKSGAGKSFFAKTVILRMVSKGIKTIVIDPEGEYVKLAQNLNDKGPRSKVLKLSHDSKYHINPFDLTKNENVEEKIQFLKGFLKRACSYYDKNEIDRALIRVYKECKIPTFVDLYNILLKSKARMADEIFNIAKGTNASLYANRTNIKISSADDLIVFDISSLDNENISLMMYLILNFIWNMNDGKTQREIFIDEAHRLFENVDLVDYLKTISKRARKYNFGIFYITQDVEDFISTEQGRSIIANTSLKVLLKQEKINIPGLSRSFSLSSDEKNSLLKFDIGEALIIAKDIHITSHIFAFDFEKEFFE